ncbi:MAG TPA: hypothetical protein VHZ03_48945, partial [Trebonia sp.]|nr:hypothetical protein [Trebonia sp.]
SGAERRCPGANDDELVGLMRAWAAVESWAAGAKLGVIAELIRREDAPQGGARHGDLPDEWSASLRHELAAALACSVQAAETITWLAWEQWARLPGVGALLADGTLTLPKARAVTETFRYLSDSDAARAESLILDQVAGKTYTQVLRLAEQAALIVDPGLAGRRREQAQKKDARVTLFRELSGTAGLSGRDLPPDVALAAMASVNARAQQYQESGAFGDTRTDVLRAYAYLDLLNAVTAEDRIACADTQDEAAEAAEALAWAEARAARASAGQEAETGSRGGTRAGSEAQAGARPSRDTGSGEDDDPDDRGDADEGGPGSGGRGPGDRGPRDPGSGGRGSGGPGSGSRGPGGRDCGCGLGGSGSAGPIPGGSGPGGSGLDGHGSGDRGVDGSGSGRPGPEDPARGPGVPAAGRALQTRAPDLVVPLGTLLGLAERPGLGRMAEVTEAEGAPRRRVAMLLIVTDGGLLLHHRDDKPGIAHPGCWAGFGGAVEAGETIEEGRPVRPTCHPVASAAGDRRRKLR